MRASLLCFALLLQFSCGSPPQPPLEHRDNKIDGKLWMTPEREDCIATKCPCECQDNTRADWIFIDSTNGKWQAVLHLPHDSVTLNLEILPGDFIIGRNSKGVHVADFTPDEHGFLRVMYGNHNLVYTNYEAHASIVTNSDLALRNAKHFLAHLNTTDTLLRSLLALDETRFYCDSVLGNVIYAPEMEVHKMWVIKTGADSLELFQYNVNERMEEEYIWAGSFLRE